MVGKAIFSWWIHHIDLNKTRLRVGLRIVTGEGKPVKQEDKVCLANFGLHTLYLGILKNKLFHKDSYDKMDSDSTNNIGFDRRYKTMMKGNTVFLEGPIRMDICQQKQLIFNGIRTEWNCTNMKILSISWPKPMRNTIRIAESVPSKTEPDYRGGAGKIHITEASCIPLLEVWYEKSILKNEVTVGQPMTCIMETCHLKYEWYYAVEAHSMVIMQKTALTLKIMGWILRKWWWMGYLYPPSLDPELLQQRLFGSILDANVRRTQIRKMHRNERVPVELLHIFF